MEMRFSIAADKKSLDQAGLKFEMGDFDGYALEVGLQLVEKQGPGEVVVVTLGPDSAQEMLRKGLAMGATRAVQLKADDVPFDGLVIARALAAEFKDGGYDLILFGRMATDTASGTVGPMTAELLGLPCVTSISHLEIADRKGTARRDLEGATETVTFPLPAVLTIDEGIARPRLASLKGIMAAKKKPLEVKPAQLGEARLRIESLALPPDRPPGRIIGEGADAVPELVRLLRDEAKVL
jgi:electron transfer flavoprotein beta subunit